MATLKFNEDVKFNHSMNNIIQFKNGDGGYIYGFYYIYHQGHGYYNIDRSDNSTHCCDTYQDMVDCLINDKSAKFMFVNDIPLFVEVKPEVVVGQMYIRDGVADNPLMVFYLDIQCDNRNYCFMNSNGYMATVLMSREDMQDRIHTGNYELICDEVVFIPYGTV